MTRVGYHAAVCHSVVGHEGSRGPGNARGTRKGWHRRQGEETSAPKTGQGSMPAERIRKKGPAAAGETAAPVRAGGVWVGKW